jgi:hypothetical protein
MLLRLRLSDIYGDEFFESLDGVTNALDNIKARTLSTRS